MTAALFAFAMILCGQLLQPEAKCISDDHTDGCSVPIKSVFFQYDFTPACKKHDVCYECGNVFGWTRYQCDVTLLRNMDQLCKNEKNEQDCKKQANAYYWVVRLAGYFFFRWYPARWCRMQDCVKSTGQPV